MRRFIFRNGGWWEIAGDRLVNIVGGGHRYIPSPDDRIVEAESFDNLDYSYLIKPDSPYGWISPEGRYYGCEYRDHGIVARRILKSNEYDLEQKGWVKVFRDYTQDRGWYCLTNHGIPTGAQQVTLERLGLVVWCRE